MAPLLLLFYATKSSEQVRYLGDYVELGFSPTSLEIFADKLEEINEDLLRPIKSSFNHTLKNLDSAFSLIIDENFFNSLIIPFIQGEQVLALRELIEANPRTALFTQLLTTQTLATFMPSFKEQYPVSTQIDLLGTVSHE